MEIDGRKIKVIVKDDQLKPDLAKAALEQAYGDDKVDIAVGTDLLGRRARDAAGRRGIQEDPDRRARGRRPDHRRQVEPLRLPHRRATPRRTRWRPRRRCGRTQIATLAQDYAFGRDGVAAFKDALAAVGTKAKIVHEEYAPQQTTDFTAPAQRIFDALKDKPGRKIMPWSGPAPIRCPR